MRVLIFGGREFNDTETFYKTMQRLHERFGFECVIEGEATGADYLARSWGMWNGLPIEPYFANWTAFGDRAGAFRNSRMLREGKPDLCVGFPGGTGTRDMAKKILKAEKPLIIGQWSDGHNSPIKWRSFNLQALEVHGRSHT